LQAAASDVYAKAKLVRRVIADAKQDLVDQDFDGARFFLCGGMRVD
jgi:hypothetical protein